MYRTAYASELGWFENAACKGMDLEVFYFEPPSGRKMRQAVVICRSCPVMADCARWALRSRERFGVWGGLSPSQRQRILRNGQRRAAL